MSIGYKVERYVLGSADLMKDDAMSSSVTRKQRMHCHRQTQKTTN